MRELLRRIAYLWNRRRVERELAEEMAYHRELMAPDRRAAFGSELRLRENTREVWGWTWLDRLRQDLAYGARVLRNSPGFSLTALLVLALGIGVPLTGFRVVMAELRGDVPPDPDTLVRLTRRAPGVHITNLPYPELLFYTANAKSFRQVIGVSDRNQAVFGEAAAGGAPEQIQLAFVTSNYFSEFGVSASGGRLWTAEDERPAADPVALLDELFWRRRFGGSTEIIGQNIRVNGKLMLVIGVIPRSANGKGDVWMPLVRQPYAIEGATPFSDWNCALDVYGRLNTGVSPKAAEQESLALAANFKELWPDHVRPGEYLDVRPILQLDPNSNELQIAVTAGALVMLLLAAACANLGTLVLARGVRREREIQIRMALGAGRARVVRQLFTESLLLAVLSGLCGLLLSSIVLRVIQWRVDSNLRLLPDWRTVAATFGIALLAALLFGLPPALRLTSLVPRAGRARTMFLAAQVAASCLLLTVSGLMAGAVQRIADADQGFDYGRLVWVSPGLDAHGYRGPSAQSYLGLLRTRAMELTGVKSASLVWLAPWGDRHMWAKYAERQFAGNHVDPQFLDTMGMRVVRGRNFRPGEEGVALITEAMERTLWPDRNSLGKTLPWDAHGATIIGVVRNASTALIGVPQPLEFFLPLSSGDAPESLLLLRVSGRPHDFIRGLQDAGRALDPRLQPMVQAVSDSYKREMDKVSGALMVMTILGAVAILLSAIGLAGLAGYTVAQRTREIGLRRALGARGGQVIGAILSPLRRPVAAGLVCGALGGSTVAAVLRSGIPTLARLHLFDPLAYCGVMAFFAAVTCLAILAPLRRAIRIHPAKALQYE